MKIKLKFMMTIAAILILGALLMMVWIYYSSYGNTRSQAIRDDAALSDAIHESVIGFMNIGQQQFLDDYLKRARKTKSVNEINILRSDALEKELGVKKAVRAKDDLDRQVLTSGREGDREVTVMHARAMRRVVPLFAEKSCLACHSSVKEGEVIGVLSTTLEFQSSLDQMVRNLFRTGLLQGMVILFAIVAIFFLFNRLIMNPVTMISTFVKKVGSGDFTAAIHLRTKEKNGKTSPKEAVATIDSSDEIGELAVAFNKMSSDLRRSTVSLAELNREIQERQTVEEAIRQSEEKFRTIFENSAVAIMLADRSERIVSWNKFTENLLGWGHDDLHLKPISSFYPPDEWQKIRSLDIRKSGMIEHLETVMLRKGGGLVDVDISISVLKDSHGNVTGSIGIARNISERKRAEEALKESERRFFDVMHASKSAILLISENKFVDANEATVLMLGYASREQFLKSHPSDLSPSTQPDGRSSFEKADEMIKIAFEKGFHQFEWMHRKANGEVFPVQVSLTPITIRGKQILYCVWIDLTRQKQDEQQLLEARQRLQEQASQLAAALDESRKAEEVLSNMLEDNRSMRGKLEQTARKLELILASTGEGILGMDLEGKHTFVNAQALKMFGFTEQEIIGKDSHKLIHHSYPDGSPYPVSECPNLKVLRDGLPLHTEEYYWRKDGTSFPVQVSSVPIVEDGKIVGLVISMWDITERKRADESLNSQRTVLSAIANSAHDAILMMDPEGIISFWNQAAERIFGWSEQEALGKNLHALLAPERFREAHGKAFPGFLATGMGGAIGQTLELAGIRKDGTEFPLEIALSGVQLAGQWHSVGIIRDITERKRAEESLIKLSRAVEQSSATIVITDSTGAIEYANPRFTQTTGYTFEEAKGKNPRILKSGEMSAEGYKRLWDTILAGNEWHGEFHNKKKNGDLYWESAAITPIRNAKGEITHFLAVKDDITERKMQQEQMDLLVRDLKAANVEVEMAMRAKGQFLANMSHEIRTPMNAILGFLDLLRATPLSEQQKDYLETVASSGEVLLAIINDILDLSKIEAGEIRLEKIDFNLEHLVEDVVRMIRPKVAGRFVQLHYRIAEEVPRDLKGDPTRLRQILLNLLSNASKFTEKGEINLQIELEEPPREGAGFLRCSVKDTGIGIPVKKQDSIFDHFTQVDASTTRKYGGTGLGLSICRNLVHLMGGKIWVESEEGKGSDFIFTFQFRQGSGVAATAIHPVGVEELRGWKVLVVDDTPRACQMLRLICQEFGMIVTEAMSGAEALERLSQLSDAGDTPGLAILDIMMPEMDGYELAHKIRAHPVWSKMKIIAATSDVRVGMAEDLRKNGFDAFLPKPITRRELISVIRTVLGDQRPEGGIVTRHLAQEFVCKGMKVLVAEDNPVNQKLMLVLLKNLGCEVECVGNGSEAVQKVRAKPYDICLMDLQMPVMGGVDATLLIRGEISKELPIIALTAAVMPEDRERSLNAGMNDFLTKPVKPPELKDILLRWGKRAG